VRCLTIFRAVLSAGPDHFSQDPQRYAMAERLHDEFAELVDNIDPETSSGGIPTLVIDAGLETGGHDPDDSVA
jgi:hypothetical protein